MTTILTLANQADAYNFYRGTRGSFTTLKPWWRRLLDWALRSKKQPEATYVVINVDRKAGTVEMVRL